MNWETCKSYGICYVLGNVKQVMQLIYLLYFVYIDSTKQIFRIKNGCHFHGNRFPARKKFLLSKSTKFPAKKQHLELKSLVHENGGYWYVLADKGVFWRASAGFDGQWRIWAESTQ